MVRNFYLNYIRIMDDKDFFTNVFLEMKSMLVGYLLSNKVGINDVEELINEIFFLAWKYRNSLKNREKVKSWIFSIAKNVLRAYKNNLKKYRARFFEGDCNVVSNFKDYHNDEEDIDFVLDLVGKLPEKYRDVFVLFYLEGKNIREICEILGISESNCKVRLMRAREKLKSLLKGNMLSNNENNRRAHET